jgi:mono/diheme cytochrome c family protein
MLKPALVLGLIALWSVSFQQGCQDLKKSLTHLTYYPIRDMRQTVAIDPQRSTWGAPDSLSVPIQGRDVYRDDTVPYDIAGAKLVAPASTEASVARGDSLFRTVCWSCHGKTMLGDGPISAQFVPPPDLLGEGTRGRSDGYIYMYMRHGGAIMPSYGNLLTSHDAWSLVHYIRHMQKTSPR